MKPPSDIPVGLAVKPVGNTKALLSWDAPQPPAPKLVTLEMRQIPSGTFKPLASGVPETSYEATALKPDCEYAFRACLQNSLGQLGLPSTEVLLGKRSKPDGLRSAPMLKELPSPSKGAYELSWPEVATGLEPPRYVIECSSSEKPASKWFEMETPQPILKSPFQLNDLKPEHEYRYRVSAENSFGRSEPSLEAVRKRKVQPGSFINKMLLPIFSKNSILIIDLKISLPIFRSPTSIDVSSIDRQRHWNKLSPQLGSFDFCG